MLNDIEFDKIMKNIGAKFTPEYFKELEAKCYEDDRNYPENFSNWYSFIKDFGYFKHTNIVSNQILSLEEVQVMQETDNIKDVDWNKILEILKPTLSKMEHDKLYNIKNGCFSNKFDFNTSITNKYNLAEQLWKINYQSSMFETGGYTEIVVRELIPNTIDNTFPTIYNGMPLREEVRVFYNMDTKQIEYIEDYWNYNYCAKNIRDKSDKIIFDWFHNKISGNEIIHEKAFEQIKTKIEYNINTLQFDNTLKGIWSIDFLYNAPTDEIYLIDMARGFRSAYWNPNLISNKVT